ncbi:hypothetical protein FRC20_006380 [Serendipita sp. 405]|nr:hypothetical protein FRC15_009399 [Serendipita sp. 397]KAG8804580.1 hypothetical protein FRC16_006022 [Serendipita sp. 398]KAG8878703.1 hypothetical protein FRC20_006380 [Serendipita sp. 405]
MIQHGATPVSRLPLELLQEIFLYHVWADKSSPIDLLFTNKTWYKAAIATSALWSRIMLGNRPRQPGMLYFTTPGRVQCTNLSSFAHAIKRAGHSPLELTITCSNLSFEQDDITEFKSSVDSEWLSRCRSLVWLSISALAGGHLFLRLFHAAKYDALEHLTIWSMTQPIGLELEAFMQQIEATAVNLRSVTLTPVLEYGWNGVALHKYPKLLRRLHALRLSITGLTIWQNLVNLVELDISLPTPRIQTQMILPPTIPLTRLTMREHVDTGALVPSIFASLTHLTLETNGFWNSGIPFPPFTALSSLELRVLYLNLPSFTAPSLHSLTLRPYSSAQTIYMKPFRIFGLNPKVLLIDRCQNETDLVDILRELSNCIEDLHVSSRFRQHVLGNPLTMALCVSGKDLLAPNLASLTVTSEPPASEDKEVAILSNLRRISRRSEDASKAVKVKYGIFPSFDRTRVMAPENKWEGTVEWVEPLEDDLSQPL